MYDGFCLHISNFSERKTRQCSAYGYQKLLRKFVPAKLLPGAKNRRRR